MPSNLPFTVMFDKELLRISFLYLEKRGALLWIFEKWLGDRVNYLDCVSIQNNFIARLHP
jgi:hypothetical protein